MDSLSRRSFLKTSASAAVVTTALAATAAAEAKDPEAFMAGVAAVDITPPLGVVQWGYDERTTPATGILDPLYARAIVLRQGDETVALITLDLGRAPSATLLDRVRDRVSASGVKHAIFTASHTHGGPLMEDETMPHFKMLEARLGECIEAAVKALEPARFGWGTTSIDIAFNRRVTLEDGTCTMMWGNKERKPTPLVDREATVIRIDKTDGKPLAVLVNYACHPVILGWDNLEYSADYVGELCRLVKLETGAECLFIQGGAGDINPYLDKTPIAKGGVEAMRGVGKICADAVLEALGKIDTKGTERTPLGFVQKMVPVGTRWNFQDPEVAKVFRTAYGAYFEHYMANTPPDLAIPLAVLLINNELAIAAISGECFVQLQLDLKAGSPVKKTLMAAYSNDYHAYIPDVKGAAAGNYGGAVGTFVGLGAGEKLITEAHIETARLAGMIRDKAVAADFVLKELDPNPL